MSPKTAFNLIGWVTFYGGIAMVIFAPDHRVRELGIALMIMAVYAKQDHR